MLLNVAICIGNIPLGILAMKAIRFFAPSHRSMANPKRDVGHACWYHAATLVVLSSSLWYIVTRPSSSLFFQASGILSLGFGMRLSVVGLTGGIGSGKTTVSRYISDQHGWVVIDADKIAREVVAAGTSGYNQIITQFGRGVINSDTKELDRKALGQIVFSDRQKKVALERITHPRIISRMIGLMVYHRMIGHKVMLDVPLMFESRSPLLYLLCHEVLLVDASIDGQRKRLHDRNPELTPTDIDNRISSQTTREYKIQRADYVINNNGTVLELYAQLDKYFS